MNTQFSQKFKYLGFIMTCGMVLFHCPIVESIPALGALDYALKTLTDSVFRSLVSLIMSYFFTVTGFLLFRDFSISNYSTKIRRRIFSLLVPYILWQLIFASITILSNTDQLSVQSFIQRTFLLYTWPVDSPLWYVYAVFLLALFSPAVYLMIKRKYLGWCLVVAVTLFAAARDRIGIPIYQSILYHGYVQNIVYYLPAYLAGAFFGYHYKDGSHDGLYLLLCSQIIGFLLGERLDSSFAYISTVLLPTALIYLLPNISPLENRAVYRLSFLIYAIHMPVLGWLFPHAVNLYAHSVGRIFMSAALAAITTRLLLLAAIIALAAVIYAIVSKVSPRLLSLLTGGRG